MNRVLILSLILGGTLTQTTFAANSDSMGRAPIAEYQLQKDRFVESKTSRIRPPMQSEQYFENKRTLRYDPTNIPGVSVRANLGMPPGAGASD